jgi:CubicO group peptidase (beta-lactamase class C family)
MASASQTPDIPIIELLPELDRLADDVMRDWRVPGAALAMVRTGEAAFVRAYGQRNVEADLPVTADTRFMICSITKSFTATAIALLHAEVGGLRRDER